MLEIGTNCGFVTVAPTTDPDGTDVVIDYDAVVCSFTSPAGATKITEVGWYCDNDTEEANFEVGLYAADGAVVPGEAGTLLYQSAATAKGTTLGWKKITVDWDISGSTVYWLAVQLDNTATTTNTNHATTGGAGSDWVYSKSTLPNPFGGGAISVPAGICSFYAVYTGSGSVTPQVYYLMN
jgi:hypothetical protein